MANDMYERQAALRINRDQRVAIIGVGGVGNWLAISLAMAGVRFLTLYDEDSVGLNNLNRFPLPLSAVGKPKAGALAGWLSYLRPDVKIEVKPHLTAEEIEERNKGLYANYDYVVACTDSLKSRKLAHKLAMGEGGEYLEIGADGNSWSLSPEPPEFSTELEGNAGYASVPVFVGPCMMAAAAASYYVLHNTKAVQSIRGDWGPLDLTHIWQGLKIATMNEVPMPEEVEVEEPETGDDWVEPHVEETIVQVDARAVVEGLVQLNERLNGIEVTQEMTTQEARDIFHVEE